MSQPEQNSDDIIYKQMRAILKPMIDSALFEMPKDPVRK